MPREQREIQEYKTRDSDDLSLFLTFCMMTAFMIKADLPSKSEAYHNYEGALQDFQRNHRAAKKFTDNLLNLAASTILIAPFDMNLCVSAFVILSIVAHTADYSTSIIDRETKFLDNALKAKAGDNSQAL